MEETLTMKVVDSDLGRIPAGATLEVTRDHTNKFTGEQIRTVETDADTSHLGGFQIYRLDDMTQDVWREIVVGRESDTIVVAEE